MYFHYFLQSLFCLAGLVCLLAALCNWEWFFQTNNSHSFAKAYRLLSRLWSRHRSEVSPPSRTPVRILYGVAGVLLMAIAAYFFHLTRLAFA
jgi:hypothetical protein